MIDVFTRQWLAFVLSSRARRHEAIMAVNNAVAAARPKAGLILRADNGTQYTSRDFRPSAAALGITIQYVYVNTPERNGHVESFHHTLKSTSGRGSLPTSMKPKKHWMRRLRTTTGAESTPP